MNKIAEALRSAGPPLLFGLRLWASVCIALYIAFRLDLGQPAWAGTTAAIVCQPRLGASLRKGWFRLIGTPIGAIAALVIAACFPQARGLFLISLALWGAICAFVSTILRNYAAYAAALAGYTSVIIACDQLGATGGPDGEMFILAVTRVTEIGIGILSAVAVLAGTSIGRERSRLANTFAALTAGIAANLSRTLVMVGPRLADTRPIRRDLLNRVIALDPAIDETFGESLQIRRHSSVLQRAVDGLLDALAGWRIVANHMSRVPAHQSQAEATAIREILPAELLSLFEYPDPARWTSDPAGMQQVCERASRQLAALPMGTPGLRLLADKTAEALAGFSHAMTGLTLLTADRFRPVTRQPEAFRLRVPDWLPAGVNAFRAFVTIGAMVLVWIASAWPDGPLAVTWAAISVILFAPRADQAYATAMSFLIGSGIAAIAAAILIFAVLPGLDGFIAFSLALGAWLVPTGAAAAQPWRRVTFTYMSGYFVPMLAPTNPMSYDAAHFYNSVVAGLAGAGAAALAFRLMPPLSPAFRARRLVELTLRDLRRLALGRRFADWEGHIHDRLSAMPKEALPDQRVHLLAAMSVGTELNLLRRFSTCADLESALAALARGQSAAAVAAFGRLDDALASKPDTLRERGHILVILEVLAQHAAYFDGAMHKSLGRE